MWQVEARVVCTAQGPFGLKGMIEGIMVDQSATSIKQYVGFCARRCEKKLAQVPLIQHPPQDLMSLPRLSGGNCKLFSLYITRDILGFQKLDGENSRSSATPIEEHQVSAEYIHINICLTSELIMRQ